MKKRIAIQFERDQQQGVKGFTLDAGPDARDDFYTQKRGGE